MRMCVTIFLLSWHFTYHHNNNNNIGCYVCNMTRFLNVLSPSRDFRKTLHLVILLRIVRQLDQKCIDLHAANNKPT